jgi:hypothetical protein
MRLKLAVPLALLVIPGAVTADVYVKAQNDRITVRAQREPLNRVLASIAREAGISVVNPSSAPSQLVNVTLENVSPQEALIRLFDGQGLNYIFQLDPSGSRVAMLILSGSSSARVASASSSSHQPAPAPQMYEEEMVVPEEEPEQEEEIVQDGGVEEVVQPQIPEGSNLPGISGSQWNPPGGVGMPQPGGAFPGAVPTPYPQQPGTLPAPVFPGGASNVNVPPPPPPSIPRFPGGISQPQPQ